MQITADVTRTDAVYAAVLHDARSPVTWICLILAVIVTFGVIIGVYWPRPNSHDLSVAGIYAIGAAVAIIIGKFVALTIRSALLATRKNGSLGKHTYTISEQGFRDLNDFNDSLYRWSGIRSLAHNASHMVVCDASARLHVIPSNAFASLPDYEAFWRAAKEYAAQAA